MNSTIIQLAALVGTLAPFLQGLLQRPGWSAQVKAILSVVVALVLGAATAVTSGQLDGVTWSSAGDVLGAAAIVFTASQASYVALSKTTALKAVNSLGGAPADVPEVAEADGVAQVEKALDAPATYQAAADPRG